MPTGSLGIEVDATNDWYAQHSFVTRTFVKYLNYLQHTPEGKAMSESLRSDKRIQALNGTSISKGSSSGTFELAHFEVWYAYCVNNFGEKVAKERLDEWLEKEQIQVLATLWVLGVDVASTVDLGNGYEVRPMAAMPDSDEKEFFSQYSFNHLARASLPRCAIVTTVTMNGVIRGTPPKNGNSMPAYTTAQQAMFDIALLLNTLDEVVCVPNFQTSYAPPDMPIGMFGGRGGGSAVLDVTTDVSTQLHSGHASTVQALLAAWQTKDEKEKKRLQLILHRLSQAKRRHRTEDMILDLGIALEMLLLDDDQQSEISYKLRLRGSWLLGANGAERIALESQFKAIYEGRSAVAHTGGMSLRPAKLQALADNRSSYVTLGGKVAQKIILDGVPDWTSLLFNA